MNEKKEITCTQFPNEEKEGKERKGKGRKGKGGKEGREGSNGGSFAAFCTLSGAPERIKQMPFANPLFVSPYVLWLGAIASGK